MKPQMYSCVGGERSKSPPKVCVPLHGIELFLESGLLIGGQLECHPMSSGQWSGIRDDVC